MFKSAYQPATILAAVIDTERIGKSFKTCAIMVLEQSRRQMRSRMVVKVGRCITDPQPRMAGRCDASQRWGRCGARQCLHRVVARDLQPKLLRNTYQQGDKGRDTVQHSRAPGLAPAREK